MTRREENVRHPERPACGPEVNDLFEPVVMDGVSEADIIPLKDGRLLLAYAGVNARISSDMGRTWSGPFHPRRGSGKPVDGVHCLSLTRLADGSIGMFFSLESRGWKDVPLGFCFSTDEGETWSETITVNPPKTRAYMCMDRGIVLQRTHKGRIVLETCYRELGPAPSTDPGQAPHGPDVDENLTNSVVYFSDDGGKTWQRSLHEVFVVLDHGRGGFWVFEEPVAVELKNGDVLMFGRTNLGQLFTSRSGDGGYSWAQPVPTGLASSYAPCMVKRIPTSGHLLMIWSQVSPEEIEGGYARHRLTCAVSKDEGETWESFKNLESLDDVAEIEAPEPTRVIVGPHYSQPADRQRYHRVPGVLRCCYPRCTFIEDKAVVSYDYGCNMDPIGSVKTKIRAIPVNWFYE